ncbi:uncharacterized protein LOC131926986 isoform X2 [Physella acuta]|uniref:uncharacterized protein LOC131926986 isoform X2 n=1 Tax=Physella acuta TaxID=109671 RepID=UPI0027DCBEDF|nr:uncharacterized protein LOC131926986 isoform X2 [Physella acuta]
MDTPCQEKCALLIFYFCFYVCYSHSAGDGVVYPQDPFKFVGESLELFCNITNKDIRENSSSLYFMRSITSYASKEYSPFEGGKTRNEYVMIPAQKTEILTTKSILLRLNNLTIDDDGAYVCFQKKYDSHKPDFIGNQIVKIDYRPKKVANIDCTVYNWESMKCTWNLGVTFRHPENINVSLVYTYDLPETNPSYCVCGHQEDCPRMTPTSCEWPKQIYLHGQLYYMKLEVKTIVKNRVLAEAVSDQFRIETVLYETSGVHLSATNVPDHKVVARLKPAPVKDLKVVTSNSTCIQLKWKHSSNPERKKFYKIVYGIKGQNQTSNITETNMEKLFCNLIPYTRYEFEITVSPASEESSETPSSYYTSDKNSIIANTSEDVPGAAPKICNGCFYEDVNRCLGIKFKRCIDIYWQDLSPSEKNGLITQYRIRTTSKEKKLNTAELLNVSNIHLTSKEFILPESDFPINISLTAGTKKGLSLHSSELVIPSRLKKPKPPQSFLVEVDNKDEKLKYYLSWAALDMSKRTGSPYFSITVVWCEGRNNKCKGDINWKILTPDRVTCVLGADIEKTRFREILIGITAEVYINNSVLSSGILWNNCIYFRNQKPQKPPTVYLHNSGFAENSLNVTWEKFDCIENPSYITEYLVKYCATFDGKMCRESEHTQNVSNSKTNTVLYDLKGNTKYMVYVIAVSAAGLGNASQPLMHEVKLIAAEQSFGQTVGITIGIIVILFFILVLYMLWKYCVGRRKKIPSIEIEPYAQTQNNHGYREKQEDFNYDSSSEASTTPQESLCFNQLQKKCFNPLQKKCLVNDDVTKKLLTATEGSKEYSSEPSHGYTRKVPPKDFTSTSCEEGIKFCPKNIFHLQNEKSEALLTNFGEEKSELSKSNSDNIDDTALLGEQKSEILKYNAGNIDDSGLLEKQKIEILKSNLGNVADYMKFCLPQGLSPNGFIKPATDYIPFDSKSRDISAKGTLPLRHCSAQDIPNSRLIERNPHCLTNEHPSNKRSVIKANLPVTDYVKIFPPDLCETTLSVGQAGSNTTDYLPVNSCIHSHSPLIKPTNTLSTSSFDSCDHVIYSDQALPCEGSSKNPTNFSGVYISVSSIQDFSSVHLFTPSHCHDSPIVWEKAKEIGSYRGSTIQLANTRPLSGVLLDLPPAYYLDQNHYGHYMTTEL